MTTGATMTTGPINVRLYALPASGVMQIRDCKEFVGEFLRNRQRNHGLRDDPGSDLCRYYLEHEEEPSHWNDCVNSVERLVYASVKPGAGGSVSLMLTPLELIERLAALFPPLRRQAPEPQEAAIRLARPRVPLVGRSRPLT
jgi:hypothetical protein